MAWVCVSLLSEGEEMHLSLSLVKDSVLQLGFSANSCPLLLLHSHSSCWK